MLELLVALAAAAALGAALVALSGARAEGARLAGALAGARAWAQAAEVERQGRALAGRGAADALLRWGGAPERTPFGGEYRVALPATATAFAVFVFGGREFVVHARRARLSRSRARKKLIYREAAR